jgi:putative selenate reductase molybdopterin-binding subunit
VAEKYNVIGSRVHRVDGYEKVLGKAKYTSDLKFPGMLHGKALRSPHPHARILGIDYRKAMELAGVAAIITAEDIPNNTGVIGGTIADCGVLAEGKVRYIGDPLAAVAAATEEIAEKALELIEVHYEVLPAVFDPEKAMGGEAPQIHEGYENPQFRGRGNIASIRQVARGDVEEGFTEADYIIEDRFETHPIDQAPLERESYVASFEPGGTLTVWAKTQGPYWERLWLSKALKIPQHRIRVVASVIGGGFGGCLSARLIYICTALALKVSRGIPVRMVNTREEEFVCSTIRHPIITCFKTGVKKDGTLTARECKAILNNGAFTDNGDLISSYLGEMFASTYKTYHLKFDGYTVYTNNSFGGAYRGYGNPQLILGYEQHIDHVAETIGMDAVEFRIKNAVEEGYVKADGWKFKSCGLKECIEKVAKEIGWQKKRGKRIKRGGKVRGVGIACGTHAAGSRGGQDSFIWRTGCRTPEELHAVDPKSKLLVQKPDGSWTWRKYFGKVERYDSDASLCVLRMNEDGTVNLEIGEIEYGQGCLTTLSMIVAEELGIRVEDVKATFGDTDGGAWGAPTFASRVTTIAGRAVMDAAQKAKKILFRCASELLEAHPEDMEAKDRKIYVKGTNEFCHIADAAFLAYATRDAGFLTVRGYWDADDSTLLDLKTGQGSQAFAHIFFASAMEVEVDIATGEVSILRTLGAYDAGTIINPIGAEGQIDGATVQGIGYALKENLNWENGRVLHTNFTKYNMLTAIDVPPIQSMFVETHETSGPYGAKGLGEPAHVPQPAAIANAVYDATGVRLSGLPITPEKILAALKERRQGGPLS